MLRLECSRFWQLHSVFFCFFLPRINTRFHPFFLEAQILRLDYTIFGEIVFGRFLAKYFEAKTLRLE